MKKSREVQEAVARVRRKMEGSGIGLSFLAGRLRVSRQYAWQITHYRTFLSVERIRGIENVVDAIIADRAHIRSFGDHLRAARKAAGLTLKEAAGLIGYTWVAVQRWEKDVCLPKPGVLWHLAAIYGLPYGWPMNELGRQDLALPGRPVHPNGRSALGGLLRIERQAPAAAHHPQNRKDAGLLFGQRKRA